MSPSLSEIAAVVTGFLEARQHGRDPAGIHIPGTRQVRRLGVALEPWPEIGTWVTAEALDALLLHRPWPLRAGALPEGVGVLAYHCALDDWLPVGFGRPLAEALGMKRLRPFGNRRLPPVMVGTVSPQPSEHLRRRAEGVFEGLDQAIPPIRDTIRAVAVAWAMDDTLVRAAAAAGVQVYVTSEFRWLGVAALREAGLGLLAVGHARAERWALRHLAARIVARWPDLRIAWSPR